MRFRNIRTAAVWLAMALGTSQAQETYAYTYVKRADGKAYIMHIVEEGETLYSIARKYDCSIEVLKRANKDNEDIYKRNWINARDTVYIPNDAQLVHGNTAHTVATMTAETSGSAGSGEKPMKGKRIVDHEVKAGETLYSIARMYETTVADIRDRNHSDFADGLKSGTTIKVHDNRDEGAASYRGYSSAAAAAPTTAPAAAGSSTSAAGAACGTCVKYVVKKDETLYAICTRQGCTVADAEKYNPAIARRGVREGDILTLPPVGGESGLTVHQVQKGETLYGIATDYKVDLNEVKKLNPESAQGGVQAGKAIIMPSTSRYIAREKSTSDYEVHKVQKDETVYSISREFNLEPADITRHNDVGKGIREGQLLVIPSTQQKARTGVAAQYRKDDEKEPAKLSKIAHTVGQGETIYSICKTYRVESGELMKANPELKDGLKAGAMIFIPRTDYATALPPVAEELPYTQGNNRVKAAVVLPFITDDAKLKANTDKFVEFYEGVLIAVRNLKKDGISVDISVVNSGKKLEDIEKVIESQELKEADIVIGPAYKSQVDRLGAFCRDNGSKLIIPFSSSAQDVQFNRNIMLATQPLDKLADNTAREYARAFKNCRVAVVKLGGKNERDMVADSVYNRMKMLGMDVVRGDFRDEESLKSLMASGKRNIIVTSSIDKVALSQFIPVVYSLQLLKDGKQQPMYDVELVGYPEWLRCGTGEDINKDLFLTPTYMLSAYDISFQQKATKEFIADFRRFYSQEPANTTPMYGAVGYDIMTFFGTAVAKYGRNFERGFQTLEDSQLPLIQSHFRFRPYAFGGGYYNAGLVLSKNTATSGHEVVTGMVVDPIKQAEAK